ncbi:uncharacterized protein LOC135174547 isoform X5 [Pogoniulus pusillus]|uniref:uncharacterized protein LOC135174547 isoform X5 n=1 Tax=Pogoniulus pusillus TaxID=488313 RepID=UPI0030B92CB7
MRRALRPGRREGRRGQSHSEGCPGGIWAPEVFLVPHIQARSIEKPKQSFSPMGRFLPRGAELLCPSPAADLHSASAPSPGRVGCFGPRPWSCLKCNCCLQLVQKWISCGCGGRNVSVGAELLCPSPAADLHSASAPSPGRVGCFGTRPWSCLKCNCCLQLVQKWISCGCGGRNVSVARAGLKPCHGEAQAPQQCLHFSSCPSELSTASAQRSMSAGQCWGPGVPPVCAWPTWQHPAVRADCVHWRWSVGVGSAQSSARFALCFPLHWPSQPDVQQQQDGHEGPSCCGESVSTDAGAAAAWPCSLAG